MDSLTLPINNNTIFINRYSDNVFENLEKIYSDKKDVININACCNIINSLSGGIWKGSLTTILGFTGSGKTTYAANIAYSAATKKQNCAYFSLEISAYDMFIKFLSRHSMNDSMKFGHLDIKRRKLDDQEKEYLFSRIYNDFKEKIKIHMYIVEESEIYQYSQDAFSCMLRDINKIFIETTGHGIDLIVIDHIQLLKFDESNQKKTTSENFIINYWVNYFRKQAMDFLGTKEKVAIILLSQANRNGWICAVKNKGTYQLTALAEANELERASSIVISVFSSDALKQVRRAQIQLLKCRDGQTMEEAIDVFADYEYYAFGDSVEDIFKIGEPPSMEEIFNNNDNMQSIDTLLKPKRDVSVDNLDWRV